MRSILLFTLLGLVACNAPTAPRPEADVTTAAPTARIKVRGYLTPLPDRRFCGYVAPIPADTTRRMWDCFFQTDTTVHRS